MRASFRGEAKPIERLFDIAVRGEPVPLVSVPETPLALQLVQDRADVDISDPAFDFVRSIRVFEITYQQRRSSDGDCNSWGTVYMGSYGDSRRLQPSSEQRVCGSDRLRSRRTGRLSQLLASVCLRRVARL